MSDFYRPISVGRVIFYGILAAAGVAAVGYFQNDHRLYIAAGFCGVFIGGFGYLLIWAKTHVKPVQVEPGKPARFPRWVYWMFYGGLAVSAGLKLWDMMHKK